MAWPGRSSSKEVNRALREIVWPALRDHGFVDRTQRTAWSHRPHCIAVVNFQSFNAHLAESLRVTTFSFAVNLGLRLNGSSAFAMGPAGKRGTSRPAEYCCDLRRSLRKTLSQPEYPRRNIWFVHPDGSNVTQTVEDALTVLLDDGLRWFDELGDPRRMLAFAETEREEWDDGIPRTWGVGTLGSPRRRQLIADLGRLLGRAGG